MCALADAASATKQRLTIVCMSGELVIETPRVRGFSFNDVRHHRAPVVATSAPGAREGPRTGAKRNPWTGLHDDERLRVLAALSPPLAVRRSPLSPS